MTSIDGSYTNDITYNSMGYATTSIMDITGPGDAVSIVNNSVYPKGFRLKAQSSNINGIFSNSYFTHDEHDWMTQKVLGDNMQTINYGYNGRGWLTSINSINSTYPNQDPCTEPEVDDPLPDPSCEDLLGIINNFLILYNCDDLANGSPTGLSISLRKQYHTDSPFPQMTSETDEIYLNGASEGNMGVLTDSISFDLNTGIPNSQTAYGILQTLIDCIENNPSLYALLLQYIEDSLNNTLDPGNTGNGPNEDDPPNITTEDIFGMEIHYENGNSDLDALPQYNGNISWMEWRVKGEQRHAYGFTYDPLNRLTKAMYGEDDVIQDELCEIKSSDKYSVNQIKYDALGNIKLLLRNGLKDPLAEVPEYEPIDNLNYSYGSSPSLLLSVSDATNNLRGFKGHLSTYGYDTTGNLTSDSQKGISNIVYSYNDLPLEIVTSKGTIENYYTSSGMKLKSIVTNASGEINSGDETRVYLAGAEYVNGYLRNVYHNEGRATFTNEGNYNEYYLKDHLGNTRVRIADIDGDQKVNVNLNDPENDEIMSTAHYYPFGMEWDTPAFDVQGNSLGESGVDSRYTYNGKELIDDLGIDLHDYGARYYDPAIARWTTVDPWAEKYTPFSTYNYTLNNPIRFIDPDGRGVTDTYGVDSDGNISKIDNKKYYIFSVGYSGGFPYVTATEVDKLVKTDSGSYSTDANGNPKGKSLDVKKGILKQGTKKGKLSSGKEFTRISTGSDHETGSDLFEFLGTNTDVEWSLVRSSERGSSSSIERSSIFSSHDENEESGGAAFVEGFNDKTTLISDTHSHPNSYKMGDESRFKPSDSDRRFAKQTHSKYPNAKLRIFYQGKYSSYDQYR